ncbi:hypothetical protein NPIL_37221 [Nephila pilipes]|uniref:Uncharacterized protein n=1 Tax=Nephila pilipes TaxID=299642 RepID=A0A8X6N274_NEPPI|nr:hypothetical protein NPIL_37221 [Nephila pilipes]
MHVRSHNFPEQTQQRILKRRISDMTFGEVWSFSMHYVKDNLEPEGLCYVIECCTHHFNDDACCVGWVSRPIAPDPLAVCMLTVNVAAIAIWGCKSNSKNLGCENVNVLKCL